MRSGRVLCAGASVPMELGRPHPLCCSGLLRKLLLTGARIVNSVSSPAPSVRGSAGLEVPNFGSGLRFGELLPHLRSPQRRQVWREVVFCLNTQSDTREDFRPPLGHFLESQ